jgi:hypothetical protein
MSVIGAAIIFTRLYNSTGGALVLVFHTVLTC